MENKRRHIWQMVVKEGEDTKAVFKRLDGGLWKIEGTVTLEDLRDFVDHLNPHIVQAQPVKPATTFSEQKGTT